jgi:hypothetical protein
MSGASDLCSSMVFEVVEPVCADLHARHPAVTVDLGSCGCVPLEQRRFAEIVPGDRRAGVFRAATPALFRDLEGAGWLQPRATAHLAFAPAGSYDPDDMFIAGRVLNVGSGRTTNRVAADQVPTSRSAFPE